MLVKVFSVVPYGIEIVKVTIEVNVAERGFPTFDIVGLPSKEISESRHRIITALNNSGFEIPPKKVVINLAPADIPKAGSLFDLPVAVGLFSAINKISVSFSNSIFFGELSLDGRLRFTHGSFLATLFGATNTYDQIFVPMQNIEEVKYVRGVNIYAVESLKQLLEHIKGEVKIDPIQTPDFYTPATANKYYVNFHEIRGQEIAKRALEISAAGGHNVMMEGPPGSGKTLLSKAYASILPQLSYEESLEVTKIYSIKGAISGGNQIIKDPPYRSPHHTISYAGMIGGGSVPKPGEVSLAHKGVLFMDEFPEYSRQVLESLRQPLEEGNVKISRSRGSFVFPSQFTLLAACNPCPCGFHGHPRKSCSCTLRQVQNYKKKISGPLLDRIDIYVFVDPVEVDKLVVKANSETSEEIFARIKKARNFQYDRYKDTLLNSALDKPLIDKYCVLEDKAEKILKSAAIKLDISARSYFRLIKVSRTIADLSQSELISEVHVAEAVQYCR